MILDLEIEFEADKAINYLRKLMEKRATIVLSEKKVPKTLQQNKYIHVLFGVFGMETGYTIKEAKTIVKRNCDFMIYEVNGEKFLKSTADLDKDEAQVFIDWFKKWALQEHNCYLPEPDEYRENFMYFEKQLDTNKVYLS